MKFYYYSAKPDDKYGYYTQINNKVFKSIQQICLEKKLKFMHQNDLFFLKLLK